ncbi:hypothetical protein [Nostoc sp. UHCC 0251]|uniref:hypothetical protein n=1 Tax=Nostoc sp. UHCC 0251 TaxID=3110240 RepID=UPI002B1F9C17|nr:hypothetical protein [Nostoc sp. UHCC 0251]MEA5623289.1 hypothetical protein [Nostoc sp. UHCC 0251]
MQAVQRFLIVCTLVFGGVTIAAIAKGADLKVAASAGAATVTMGVGAGAIKP